MSTTFEVFPRTEHLPTFDELLAKTSAELRGRLTEQGIAVSPELHFKVMAKRKNRDQGFDSSAALSWPENTYAWFYVEGLGGGTDAYYWQVDDICRECWDEDLQSNERVVARSEWVRECLAVGHYWNFRRSAGQSATINLVYGIIAATLAGMTDGFIWSDDSAWDYERFPATAEEFLACYFRPDQAISPECREWSERCWQSIPEELGA